MTNSSEHSLQLDARQPKFELARPFFDELLAQAASSPRRRMFRNIHQSHDEPVQRLVIAMLPDSYVPIHRHNRQHQWEMFIVLAGSVDMLCFDEQGVVTFRQTLTAGQSYTGLELPPGVWHTLVCDTPCVFIEIKQGPFDPNQPRDTAPFCPVEQSTDCPQFLRWLKQAQLGDMSSWCE